MVRRTAKKHAGEKKRERQYLSRTVARRAAASLASAGSPPRMGDGMTGVTRQRAEHEGNPPGQFDETHSGYANA